MIVISFLFFDLFLLWTIFWKKNFLKKVDYFIFSKLFITKYRTLFFKIITEFASNKILTIILIISLLLIDLNVFLCLSSCLVINCILNGIAKYTFKRKRPTYNPLIKEKGYSYPSGHTMSACSFYGFIIFLVNISSLIIPFKFIIIIFLLLLILLIAFSRIYLGVHYFSDIIAGVLLSCSYLAFYIYIVSFVLNIV